MASSKNINNDNLCNLDDVRYISKDEYEKENARTQVTINDILLTTVATLGRSCVFIGNVKNLTFQRSVSIITTFMKPEYLKYYFDASYFQKHIENNSTGNAQKGFYLNQLEKVLVCMPPFSEQQRIADCIERYNAIISRLETDIKSVKDTISVVKSKILDLAIRGKLVPQNPDDEPASVLLERIRAEKEELIKAGKIKRDKKQSVIFKGDDNSYYRSGGKCTEKCEDLPFDLPKGWQWTSLGQCCEKVTDQVASGSFAALRENVLSLKEPNYAIMVKTADFSNNFTKNLTYTDKHGYEFLENSNLFGGELILSNIGSIGKVFIVPDLKTKMTLAPNSVMIRLTNNECKDYLYYFLLSPTGYTELKAISTGVAMLKFNKTDLKTIYFPLPPLVEQKRIVKAIETIFATLDAIATQVA